MFRKHRLLTWIVGGAAVHEEGVEGGGKDEGAKNV